MNIVLTLAILAIIILVEIRYSPRLDFSRADFLVIWYTDKKGKRVFKILY